ncbi:MAG: hypothetical protein H8E66_08070 [Planctomycetes bacterium]|nr:hypothetical protein [Planctomycetota bacterium]
MSNLNQWHNFPVPLNNPWTSFPIPWIGWHLIFAQTGTGPALPTITPITAPSNVNITKNKVVSAGVSLPEGGGSNFYWVPVTETHLAAELQTVDWTVTFIRSQSP